MPDWKRRLVGLGLPCLLALLLDTTLTLRGQPADYWAGDYAVTTEGGPFFRPAYALHPRAAVLGHGLWAGLFLTLLVLLPEVPAVVLTIVVTFTHVAGARSWLTPDWGADPHHLANALFVGAALALGAGLHWVLRHPARGPAASWHVPAEVRVGLSAVVVGLAYYLLFAAA